MEQKNNLIRLAIKKYMQSNLLELKLLGSGGNGEVYWCKIDIEPFEIAVKVTNYPGMLKKEVDTINYINDRVDIKLPKIYFYHSQDEEINTNIIGMSYLDGISSDKVNWNFKCKQKKEFAEAAVNNFLNLRCATNDTYGVVGSEQFGSWLEFYRPFAKARLEYISKQKGFPQAVKNVLQITYDNLDIILKDAGKPTLTHGDYWAPNLLANKKTLQFVGCVDPFNLMWAESEYEIFAMILYPKLNLYNVYKSKVHTSELCDLKARMYSLFSEVYWFELLGKGSFGFMKWVAGKLKKLLKKHKILV